MLAECLVLVGNLYASLADAQRYAARRAECEAWIFRHRKRSSGLAAFLRHQLARASDARQAAHEARAMEHGSWGAIAVDEDGTVLAAAPEAWLVLRSGDPERSPLFLPAALRRHLIDVSAAGGRPPRALRFHLDRSTSEAAALLLGVDDLPRRGRAARVSTLVMWELTPQPAPAIPLQATGPANHPCRRSELRRDAHETRASALRLIASDD